MSKEQRRKFDEMNKKVLVGFCVILAVVAIISGLIGAAIKPAKYIVQSDEVKVVAEAYDSLWGLSAGYCPHGVDVRDWIDIVAEYNNLSTTTIQQGQVISIPVFEEANFNYPHR